MFEQITHQANETNHRQSPKKNLWNRSAIFRLIHFYHKKEDKFQSSACKNETVYKEIAQCLCSEGYSFTPTQCRDKFKYLKLKYMKKIDNMKNTGEERVHFEYFDEMEQIFGKKANTTPIALASLSEGWVECKCLSIWYIVVQCSLFFCFYSRSKLFLRRNHQSRDAEKKKKMILKEDTKSDLNAKIELLIFSKNMLTY